MICAHWEVECIEQCSSTVQCTFMSAVVQVEEKCQKNKGDQQSVQFLNYVFQLKQKKALGIILL